MGSKLKEALKTALIFVLLLSTAYLTYRTWLYDSKQNPLLTRRADIKVETHGEHTFKEVARPTRCAVTMEGGRYGLEYDPTAIDLLYNRVATTVGEALGSAGKSEEIVLSEWQAALSGTGIYFDFLGDIPLTALALWQEIEISGDTGMSARRLVLSAADEDILLYYADESTGRFFRSPTAVKSRTLLEKIGSIEPNGCLFAFEVGDRRFGARSDTMVFKERHSVRQAGLGKVTADDTMFNEMMQAFSLAPYLNNSYTQQNGTRVVIDNTRSFMLTKQGTALYFDSLEERGGTGGIRIPGGKLESAEVIEKLREIVENTAAKYCGDARVYLDGYKQVPEESKITVTFSYSLASAPVFMEDYPYAAYFEIENGHVSYARIEILHFTLMDGKERPLPVYDADLLAKASGKSSYELGLCYRQRGDELSVEWYRQRGGE